MVLPACPFANKALVATNVSILLANLSCLAATFFSSLPSDKAYCLFLLLSSADCVPSTSCWATWLALSFAAPCIARPWNADKPPLIAAGIEHI